MTAIDDFCVTIRQWMNWGEEEYPNPLITTMVRMGEERLNEDLRIADMIITSSDNSVAIDRFTLPDDWLESDFVRVVDGEPLEYKSRNDFYTKNADGSYDNRGKFTTIGRELIVSTDLNGESIEVSYFGRVPSLDGPTWLYTKYSGLYISATLVSASAYYVEDDRLGIWTTNVTDTINRLNAAYRMAQPSGSRLNVKTKRTFG